MSTLTIDRPQATISITDSTGTELRLLHIEGKTLEQYFDDNKSSLVAVESHEVAIVNGFFEELDKPVDPFAEITVGLFAELG